MRTRFNLGVQIAERREELIALIQSAGAEQAWCGHQMLCLSQWGDIHRRLVEYQERQAASYQRMIAHRRSLAALDVDLS